LFLAFSMTGVTNLSLSLYPFSIWTDEHERLKFLMTERLSRNEKNPLHFQ